MDVHPTVSTIVKTIESDGVVAPQISSREAQTTVRVKNGETLIIGGLLKDEEIESITRIPFLSKLPIVGKLFSDKSSSKNNTEIVIMLRPVIEGTEKSDSLNNKEINSAKKIAGDKFIGTNDAPETK